MSATPRLASAFPQTPKTEVRQSTRRAQTSSRSRLQPLPGKPDDAQAADGGPLIPFDVVDPATQRFWALGVYVALLAWRIYDWNDLILEDADSFSEFGLFVKWALIDGVFFYGLPAMRIPWLEWSWTATAVLFLSHALLDGMLMFRVPLPFGIWLSAFSKALYDREISISEKSVKPADVIHNSSIILGRQIIHILPEGSAALNPESKSFCLDQQHISVTLPLTINQTMPVLIELVRYDIDTNTNETITISAKQARNLKKQADKHHAKHDVDSPRTLMFPVKKTGLYRLHRVVDESKLEVRRRGTQALVVSCPRARMRPAALDKCRGEFSDVTMEVDGTPPLKIKYSKTINNQDRGFSFQNVQPENFQSPLNHKQQLDIAMPGQELDVSWARMQTIKVPLNESLSSPGRWIYSIEEVHDAFGNIANYTFTSDESDQSSEQRTAELGFQVHERPKLRLAKHDVQNPIRAAKTALVPIPLTFSGGKDTVEGPYQVTYIFTPQEDMQAEGEHMQDPKQTEVRVKNAKDSPYVNQPGLYTLQSVKSRFCQGDVIEPSSVLLVNPPKPELAISSEPIADKCAGRPIGLSVALDMIGTPPFTIEYEIHKKGEKKPHIETVHAEQRRTQVRFQPHVAGDYTYKFRSIKDAVYKDVSLPSDLVIEQDVKPPASAQFAVQNAKQKRCMGEAVSFEVELFGEPPFKLNYELVHNGKRTKQSISDIKDHKYTIDTGKLTNGGEYALSLASIEDKTNCKIFLDSEVKIDVRRQRPKAAFGQLEGGQTLMSLEDRKVKLPLRLSGESPWTVRYKNINESSDAIQQAILEDDNGVLTVKQQGVYEIIGVHDAICPGIVDEQASRFEVKWVPRPTLSVADSSAMDSEGDAFVRKDVCEGDEDSVDISLSGSPPYSVKYEQHLTPDSGPQSYSKKSFTASSTSATIQLDAARAGLYEYRFTELSDQLYDHESKKHHAMIVKQRVHSRPSARFVNSGKQYKFCKDSLSSDEVIPILLSGMPPFQIEIGVKHSGAVRPEIIRIPIIDSDRYDLRLQQRSLALGTHTITVRKVKDARGCEWRADQDASPTLNIPSVKVYIVDVPTIIALEHQQSYCVGDRISFALSGKEPFTVLYSFNDVKLKAVEKTSTFKRFAEKPGTFVITGLLDADGECKVDTQIEKTIHQMPSVRISKGKETTVDIPEGGEADLVFEFTGTPPFEFTYTRSSVPTRGHKAKVLETKHDVSYEHSKVIKASQEGAYEVIAIKDKNCAFSIEKIDRSKQKLLQY